MVVTEQEADGELPMLGFERLTYVPFDIRLIDRSLLAGRSSAGSANTMRRSTAV